MKKRSFFLSLITFILCVIFCLSTNLYASNAGDIPDLSFDLDDSAVIMLTNKNAIFLLEQGKYNEAQTDLLSIYENKLYDEETIFLLGLCAKELGSYQKAISYFQKLLSINPSAQRARLELAVSYFLAGNVSEAKKEFLVVKAPNPPPMVGKNINLYLNKIDGSKFGAFSFSAGIGFMYDSNVNSGPIDDIVTIYGLPFLLSTDAKPQSDTAMNYSFRGNHLYQLPNIKLIDRWISQFSVRRTDYFTHHAYDTLNFSFSTGPQIGKKKWSLYVPYVGSRMSYGNGNYYNNFTYYTNGVAPQFTYQIQPATQVGVTASLAEKRYHNNKDQSPLVYGVTPSISHFLSQSLSVRCDYNYQYTNSGIATLSNRMHAVSTTIQKSFLKELSSYATASYSSVKYSAQESLYSKRRDDDIWTFGVGFNYLFEEIGTSINTSYNYSKTDSNIGMYENKKETISFMVNVNF